jgi:hypothetical protein
MDALGVLAVVWIGALAILVLIIVISRRARRHGGSYRAGVVGAMYEWQNRDKQKALEVIVDGKAAEKPPESADGNLPELESPKDAAGGRARKPGARDPSV